MKKGVKTIEKKEVIFARVPSTHKEMVRKLIPTFPQVPMKDRKEKKTRPFSEAEVVAVAIEKLYKTRVKK